MPQTVAIIGAAGQIAAGFAQRLLAESDDNLVLIGRKVSTRLEYLVSGYDKAEHAASKRSAAERVTFVDADFTDVAKLVPALQGSDVAYINSLSNEDDTRALMESLQQAGVKHVIGATIAGIENEVPQELKEWTLAHLPASYVKGEERSAALVREAGIEYILLRLTWLYDDQTNRSYELIASGEAFEDAEVSREAVVQAILDILSNPEIAWNTSYGVGEPETHYPKPSFY